MKITKALSIVLTLMFVLTACSSTPNSPTTEPAGETTAGTTAPIKESVASDITEIVLSDNAITVNGVPASSNEDSDIYTANDIVYYESGKDFTYGEGSENDAHPPEEAAAHTVVHITKAGKYIINGKLSQGQIAVDLGEDAKNNSDAVVTLILNGADITCNVAPAIIFYNVYECGNDNTETATKDVDTTAAGANVIIADGTENTVNGSYVERIYKPGTVTLSEDGTEVEDAEKLHKYDAAFYSKMSMNVNGGQEGTGVLNINAENEGLDSELHLTVNGGNINILSGNDGINTNEDAVSVTTVNGGTLKIKVTGETGEGDGIDSNGWLVINGGTVIAAACSESADAGIDSDMGIHINGGTVIASGSMLDRIEDGGQSYAIFNLARKQNVNDTLFLKDEQGNTIADFNIDNAFSVLIYSSPYINTDNSYALWSSTEQLAEQSSAMIGPGSMIHGGMPPEPPM